MESPTAAKSPAYHLAPPVLAVLLFYLPMTMPFAPAPLYYALAKRGRKYGLIASVGGIAAVGIISGAAWALVFTAVCVLMAVAAAVAFWRGASLGLSVAVAGALPFAATMGFFAVTAYGSGSSPSQASHDMAAKAVESLLEKRPGAVGDKLAIQEAEANKDTLVWAVSAVFPAVLLNMAFFLALVHYLFSRSLSMKFGWGIHQAEHDLAAWRAPDKAAWALAGGIALSLTGAQTVTAAIGLNVAIVAGMLFSLHGLSIIHYWLVKSSAPSGVSMIAFALMFLALPWAAGFLAFLGLADALADFRGISYRSGGPAAR